MWYSGTPKATDFSETQSGFALVIEVGDGDVSAKEVRIGQWRFIERRRVDLNTGDDVEALRKWLGEVENKERTVLPLHLVGSLSLSLHGLLQNTLLAAGDVFGSFEVREDDLLVLPADADFADPGSSDFADGTVQRLRSKIADGGDEDAAPAMPSRSFLGWPGGGMRSLRLRVANYRGIDACEVKFGSFGITFVQGPNEVGEPSLGEAIGLLFEYLAPSKNRSVEAIRPVHRDERPEIELQAESGPYAFTYFKQFYKKPETKVTITLPKPENHTGREAHERAEAILRETLDIDLWKALAIQQGDAIHQPVLTKQTSLSATLSATLDKAARGRPADPREEGLFDKVREEYSRYFTERGAEKKDLQEGTRLQADTQVKITRIEQQIGELEEDIERSAMLQRE